MNDALSCSKCNGVIIKSMNAGVTKIRGKILLCKNQQFMVVCKSCGNEVPIPVKWDDEQLNSSKNKEHLRLYVKK